MKTGTLVSGAMGQPLWLYDKPGGRFDSNRPATKLDNRVLALVLANAAGPDDSSHGFYSTNWVFVLIVDGMGWLPERWLAVVNDVNVGNET